MLSYILYPAFPSHAGNYDTFVKTVQEQEIIQQKKYEKEQV